MKNLIRTALAAASVCVAAQAATISAPFNADYTLVSLTGPAVTGPYGGIAFLDNNTLLIGGSANNSSGVIDEVAVTRDINGNINGFGAVTQFSTAPDIDGGLAFGPGGDLFYTGYPIDTLGEIKPGSTSPDDVVPLSPLGVAGSVGTLAFVPDGFNGAGNFVLGSYSAGTFCTASLTPDGSGTYNVGTCTANAINSTFGGPEGIIYVPQGSADFSGQTALVSLYGSGAVDAYSIDANGLPIATTAASFVTGLGGAEGAVIDPETGDFLFSTFGGGNQIIEVQGFAVPPPATPEPSAIFLMAAGLASIVGLRRRAVR